MIKISKVVLLCMKKKKKMVVIWLIVCYNALHLHENVSLENSIAEASTFSKNMKEKNLKIL